MHDSITDCNEAVRVALMSSELFSFTRVLNVRHRALDLTAADSTAATLNPKLPTVFVSCLGEQNVSRHVETSRAFFEPGKNGGEVVIVADKISATDATSLLFHELTHAYDVRKLYADIYLSKLMIYL